MEKFIKLTIETNSTERLEIIMAELSEINFYAFEENKNVLSAYIQEENFDQAKLEKVLLNGEAHNSEIIEDRNWNEEWELAFQPVCIKDFAGIRASFHAPLLNVKHEIIITPKMSFGTGHHDTTRLMIEQMEDLNFKDKNVLDYGTGTGVLAILAEKLGAKNVVAIDHDEWSIDNAFENIKANSCTRIILENRDNVAGIVHQDMILANINLNVLIQNANDISSISHKNTLLLISGFLIGDETHILCSFNKVGFIKRNIIKTNDWISLTLERE